MPSLNTVGVPSASLCAAVVVAEGRRHRNASAIGGNALDCNFVNLKNVVRIEFVVLIHLPRIRDEEPVACSPSAYCALELNDRLSARGSAAVRTKVGVLAAPCIVLFRPWTTTRAELVRVGRCV